MTPGNPDIRHCPNCQKLVGKPTLNSGNTIGATVWLDNKREAPMLPDYPDLGRCPHCEVLMRQSTSAAVDSSGYDLPAGAQWLKKPTEADWLESLQNAMWHGTNEEIHARLAALHAANDSVRQNEGTPQFSDAARQNLMALSSLLGASDEPFFVVLRAEISRECGDFDTALALLHTADPQFEAMTSQITALAHARDTSIKRRQRS